MTVEADLFSSVAQPLAVGALDRRAGARDGVPGLDALRASGVLRDVDVHFARTVARLAGVHDPLVLLGLDGHAPSRSTRSSASMRARGGRSTNTPVPSPRPRRKT